MKIPTIIALSLLSVSILSCGKPPTATEQIQKNLSNVYPLTDEERALADANAKKYFEQVWPVNQGEPKQGKKLNCRPTDSNKNGLISCTGYVVNLKGEYVEKTVYAGYRPDVVGVSDQDTVQP